MAVPDLEKIVKIVFAGDDTGLGKTITSVGGGLDALSAKVGKATQPFADLTDTIIKIDAVLAGLAVGALVLATKSAGDFADSFAEISTLIDAPAEKIDLFKKQVIDYARESGKSIEDIQSSLYNLISAGEDYETSLDFLRAAEELAIATKSDLNTAIEILRPTLTAFGKGTEEAGNFANILFLAVKNGKLTLSELEPVLSNVTGIATASGVSFNQVAAALSALTAAGAPVNLAVTQLKGAITGLFAPAEGAKKEFQELEIAFGKNALEGTTLNEVFALMVEKTGGTLEGMKALIPRVEGASAALVLGGVAAGNYGDALDQMQNNTEAASEAFDKMSKNFALSNQNIINNIKATLIDIGLPLLDEWGNLAEQIAIIFGKAAEDGSKIDWSKFFDPLIEQTEGLLDELTAYFAGIGKALPEALEGIDWSGFTKAIEDLVETGKDLFGQLLGGLDLTKAEDLEIAIQKVVDTFENWVKLTEGLIKGLGPFLVKLSELVSKFTELDEETLKSAGQFFGWGKAINTIADTIPLLTAPLNLLSGSIGLLSITQIPSAIAALGKWVPALNLGSGALLLIAQRAAAFGLGWTIGTVLKNNIPIVKEFGDKIGETAFEIINLGEGGTLAALEQAKHTEAMGKAAVAMVKAKEAAGELASQVEKIPPIKFETNFESVQGDFEGINAEIDELILKGDIDVNIDAELKDEDFKKSWNELLIFTEDGKVIDIDVPAGPPVAKAKEVSEKVDKELEDKLILIKLQGDIDIELAKIKTQAETVQTFFEWQAKVEIAEINAQVEELKIGAELVGKAWESTGDVISAALGALDVDLSATRWHDVLDIIDREQDIREDLAEQMILLQEAQIKLLEARAKALAEGKGLIQITTDGLEPELEQVLYKIVQKAQVKANEEGFNALLGI